MYVVLMLTRNLQSQTDTSWNQLPQILARINAPVFPDKTFNIIDYGAKTDGIGLSTSAINNAITACNTAGGGKVIVPKGTFVTGAIHLKSNVNLNITQGATLLFSTAPADYLPVVYTRFEGVECYNYSPFIYAFGESNIAITGKGTLDGQAATTNWWAWKTTGATDVANLNTMGQNGVPVSQRIFGTGYKIRPNFIQPYRCTNVLIDSVTILRSPMWELHPVLCTNVTISNLTINSHGPNNDGCNPECCKDVLIRNCTFDTGDDCIAIKSGRNNDGRRVNVPSSYIVIQNCTMKDGHGGITMGSECAGSIRNIFAENCNLSSTNLDRALRVKTNSVRGGVIENVFMRNCTIGQVASEVLQVDMQYEEGDIGSFTPTVRNIELNHVTGSICPKIFNFNCYQRSPVSNVKVMNCSFNNVSSNTLVNVEKLQIYNTTSNGTIPFIPATLSGYTHAESYTAKSDWGWSNVLAGFTGNAYMEPCSADNYIEWTINTSIPSVDTLVWQYSNPDNGTSICSLYVNGQYQNTVFFAPGASSWQTLKTPYTTSQGTNTIRLVASSNKLYIDRFNTIKGPAVLTQTDDALNPISSLAFYVSHNQSHSSSKIILRLEKSETIRLELMSTTCGTTYNIYDGLCSYGDHIFDSDMYHHASGLYIIHLYTSQGHTTRKVFIE